MLRAARLLLQQQRIALGAAAANQARLLQQQPQLHLWRTAVVPMAAVRLRSSPFATKAAREQEEEEEGDGDGSSKNKKRTLKQRLKETPVDPRLYQHLERLGLGADSTRRPPKGQRRRKQRVKVDMDKIEARLKKESIPYFQANRFTQAKRALRRERRRLVREASNRLHLLNRAQVERARDRVKNGLRREQQQRAGTGPAVSHQRDDDEEDDEDDGVVKDDRARRLARIFRASAASGSVRFATAAFRFGDLPAPLQQGQQQDDGGRGRVVPEVALAGRSNVGKSTLLNALLGLQAKRGAAAVGDKPGVTKSLDFYRIGSRSNPRLVVVDLPGYGFAYGKEERVEQCQQLTLDYLRHRGAPLKRLLLLLDARHGLKHQDRAFLQRLYAPPSDDGSEDADPDATPGVWDSEAAALEQEEEEKEEEEKEEVEAEEAEPRAPLPPFKPPKLQVVFTKCDLLPRDELAKRILLTRRELEAELLLGAAGEVEEAMATTLPKALVAGLPSLMVAAARGRKGLAELQAELAALLPRLPTPPPAKQPQHQQQQHAATTTTWTPKQQAKPREREPKVVLKPSGSSSWSEGRGRGRGREGKGDDDGGGGGGDRRGGRRWEREGDGGEWQEDQRPRRGRGRR